ncbi:PREDICTED: uncharacterized protein LOC108967560 [Bactrocera latifrons]|uniref:Uncharacterized protein n=1 Tax=Bactrocera latifrons TaxID=174628 RepID=A0A0K8WCZ3_BACLA|nr:PREDICTED: uncharacterized protein LOC108967560 [Bactrocera latifrons]
MFTGSSTMTYANRRELKCQFQACPCEKCVCFREERLASGCFSELSDTPPERPSLKYAQDADSKFAYKPYNIDPEYKRKDRPIGQQRKQDTQDTDEVKKCCSSKADACDSGKGCCNTNGNFMSYLINVISFIAFTIIALLLFWLKMCEWTFALCKKTYHSNRKTQLIVISITSIILLTMFSTYLITGTPLEKHMTSCKESHCATETKEFTVTITDDQSHEIYKQSKLYAIPLEMKQPPTLLLYLRSLILKDE